MSSLNWYLRWIEFCGTLVLVPNCMPPGNVIRGFRVELSIRLFQYWKPRVNWLTSVGVSEEFTVKLATWRWLTVKFPSVRSNKPLLWSFRLLFAWVETDK